MSWWTNVHLSVTPVRDDLTLPNGVGVTLLKDGIFFPGRVVDSERDSPLAANEACISMLSTTVPTFEVGETVGLYAGPVELGTGRVLSFDEPRTFGV